MAVEKHRWDPVAATPHGLTRPVPLDPAGVVGPTRGQARGPSWRASSHGRYVPAVLAASQPEQRILEQSIRLPSGGAVTGWAGMRLHGAGLVDGLAPDRVTPLPVPLAVGPHVRLRPSNEVVVLREQIGPDEVWVVHGIPCAMPERSVFDAVARAPDLVEAVVLLEMGFAGEVTSLSRMREYVGARSGRVGLPQVRHALDLATEHSVSPNETRYRMVWQLAAGLPAPLVNQPIFDRRGRLLGFPDLLDVESGLVGEFDGADHRGAIRHRRDIGREARFRDHGLEVTRATGLDLPGTNQLAARVLAARQRSRWLPPQGRAWTVETPDGWDPGRCLDERLDLRDLMRDAERGLGGAGVVGG